MTLVSNRKIPLTNDLLFDTKIDTNNKNGYFVLAIDRHASQKSCFVYISILLGDASDSANKRDSARGEKLTSGVSISLSVAKVTPNQAESEAISEIIQNTLCNRNLSHQNTPILKLILVGQLREDNALKAELETANFGLQVCKGSSECAQNCAIAFQYLLGLQRGGFDHFECIPNRPGRYEDFSDPFLDIMIGLMESAHKNNDRALNENPEGLLEKRPAILGVVGEDYFNVIKVMAGKCGVHLLHSNSSYSRSCQRGFANLMCKTKTDQEFIELANRGNVYNVSDKFTDMFPPNFPFAENAPRDLITTIFAKAMCAEKYTIHQYKREDLANATLRFFFQGILHMLWAFSIQSGARDIYIFDAENKMENFMLHYIDNRMFIRDFADISVHFMTFEHLNLLGEFLRA